MLNKTNVNLLYLLIISIFLNISCSKDINNLKQSKIDSILSIADDTLKTNPSIARNLIGKAEKMAKDTTDRFKIVNFLIAYFIQTNQIDSVNVYQKKFKNYLENIKNSSTSDYDSLSMRYYNVCGIIYSYENNFDSATSCFNHVYNCAKRNSYKTLIPDICINMADIYNRQGDYASGIKYYREALRIADSLKMDNALRFPIYAGIGYSYFAGLMNYDLADIYFIKAENIIDGRSMMEKFIFYNNWGTSYYYRQDYHNSLIYFLKAKKTISGNNAKYFMNLTYVNLSDVYLHLNELDSAKNYYRKGYDYFSKSDMSFFMSYLALVKAGIELKENNTRQALSALRSYNDNDYKDALIIDIRYKLFQDYYLKTKQYKEAYNYLLKSKELNDSLRSLAVRNTIAETDMRYRLDTAIIRQNFDIVSKNDQIHNLWISNLLWIMLLILTVLIGVFVLISRKREIKIQRIKQGNVLAKLRIQNIRNRISPHFIFNILNRHISTQIDEKQNLVLLTMVEMLRKSLLLTDSVYVSLQDELDFVNKYINLEKTGLGDNFEFEIKIANNINAESIKVLSMIIQIPVENAIKHALRPKQGQKKLSISISGYQDKTSIKIIDNGLGYKPENNTKSKGTGTGLKVIYQTIAVLNNNNKQKIEFDIRNITDNDITGTEVSITIPYKYNFEI